MNDKEFNRQYDAARARALITDLAETSYFQSLSAEHLFEALCERLEEQMNLEESEIKTILGIIADRLGRLEEIEAGRKAGKQAKGSGSRLPG